MNKNKSIFKIQTNAGRDKHPEIPEINDYISPREDRTLGNNIRADYNANPPTKDK